MNCMWILLLDFIRKCGLDMNHFRIVVVSLTHRAQLQQCECLTGGVFSPDCAGGDSLALDLRDGRSLIWKLCCKVFGL